MSTNNRIVNDKTIKLINYILKECFDVKYFERKEIIYQLTIFESEYTNKHRNLKLVEFASNYFQKKCEKDRNNTYLKSFICLMIILRLLNKNTCNQLKPLKSYKSSELYEDVRNLEIKSKALHLRRSFNLEVKHLKRGLKSIDQNNLALTGKKQSKTLGIMVLVRHIYNTEKTFYSNIFSKFLKESKQHKNDQNQFTWLLVSTFLPKDAINIKIFMSLYFRREITELTRNRILSVRDRLMLSSNKTSRILNNYADIILYLIENQDFGQKYQDLAMKICVTIWVAREYKPLPDEIKRTFLPIIEDIKYLRLQDSIRHGVNYTEYVELIAKKSNEQLHGNETDEKDIDFFRLLLSRN